ncbi:hypothetical protein [Streptomyces indicus]|uniref:Uncharacterized protein n=1 Tax=Streptomyces indicus TaxID=417292 RepID=A0A1G9GA81_9ACTN|nr:hypothetical protein [Streptomyces indicus]SDK97618.1 hypothetical protein SAMN05421806_11586 [Streptomyces indicus]
MKPSTKVRAWLGRLREGWGSGRRPAGTPRESDVAQDAATAASRPTGGDPHAHGRTAPSTTGTGPSGRQVGRVAGEDPGDAGETGAEARGSN